VNKQLYFRMRRRVLRPGCSCGGVGTGRESGRDRLCGHEEANKHLQ